MSTDELKLEGKKYISSKRAARISGYTKDYIGQLCRAGALPARMVGRSWYIEEQALKAHRKTYQGEPVIDTSVWDVDRIEEGSQSLRDLAAQYLSKEEVGRKERLLDELFDLKYEPDHRPLMPEPVRTSASSQIEAYEHEVAEDEDEHAFPAEDNQRESEPEPLQEERDVPVTVQRAPQERPISTEREGVTAAVHTPQRKKVRVRKRVVVRRRPLLVPILGMCALAGFVFWGASLVEGVTTYLDSEDGYYLETRQLQLSSVGNLYESIVASLKQN